MCTINMANFEQERDDAIFEVCDARERYPTLCTNELAQCIKLENEICIAPVKAHPPTELDTPIITKEQIYFLENLGVRTKYEATSIEQRNKKLTKLLDKMEDLKVVAAQIEREKHEDINRLLRK